MKRFQGVLAGVILTLFAVACGGAMAGTENDHTLHESQYQEYFKQEGNGDKNYLYTVTHIPAPAPGECNIVSADSEQTITMACNTNPK